MIFSTIYFLGFISENLGNVPSIPNVDLMETRITTDVRLTYFIYRDGNMFMAPSELDDQKIYQAPNSQVVSGSVGGLYIYNLTEPVVIVFNQEQVDLHSSIIYFLNKNVNSDKIVISFVINRCSILRPQDMISNLIYAERRYKVLAPPHLKNKLRF